MKKTSLLLFLLLSLVSTKAFAAWTNLADQGKPKADYYLGDFLNDTFEFCIDEYNWQGYKYGVGKSASDDAGWIWKDAVDSDRTDDDNNDYWKSKTGEIQFTSTGMWYYSGKFIHREDWQEYACAGWKNNRNSMAAEDKENLSYYHVNDIPDPTNIYIVQDPENPSTQTRISWNKNVAGHAVMVVRINTGQTFTTPLNGIEYSAGNTIGNGIVVFYGSSTECTDTELLPGTEYIYKLYSVNNTYYSQGVTSVKADRTGRPETANFGQQSSPMQPTTIYLGDKLHEFGAHSWRLWNYNVSDHWYQGRNRVVIKHSEASNPDKISENGIAGEWYYKNGENWVISGHSDITDSEENRISYSPQFTKTGIWYWGIQFEYQLSNDFWYCGSSSSRTGMKQASEATTSLSVNVLPLEEPLNISVVKTTDTDVSLSWNRWENRDVLIVRYELNDLITTPVQGQAYFSGNTIGNGTVVFRGYATSANDVVEAGKLYKYVFYSENWSYYSNGISVVSGCYRSVANGGWNETGTWNYYADCDGNGIPLDENNISIPGASDNVHISANTTVSLSETTNINNLTINNDGELNMNGQQLTVMEYGELINNGALNVTNGTVEFQGVGAISGTTAVTLHNLTINNQLVEVTTDLEIAGDLQIKSGTLKLANNDLTLQKTSHAGMGAGSRLEVKNLILSKEKDESVTFDKDKDAALVITEKIKSKIQFTSQGWQFIGFPFELDGTIRKMVTNPDCSVTVTDAVFDVDYIINAYNASVRAQHQSGWEDFNAVPMANKGYILNARPGYSILFSADPSLFNMNAFEEEMDESKLHMNYTSCNPETYPAATNKDWGWNLVSNPYVYSSFPDIIAIDNMEGYFYYGYVYGADNYMAVDYLEENNSVKPQAFDAFFLKVPSTCGISTPDQTGCSKQPTSYRAKQVLPLKKIKLTLKADAYSYSTSIRILQNATNSYDELYDAGHIMAMNAATPQIYTLVDNSKFAINSIPEETTTVAVGVRVPAIGTYTLSWDTNIENEFVILYDNLTGESVNLHLNEEYTFETTLPGEINNRFTLKYTTPVTTGHPAVNNHKDINVTVNNNNIKIEGLKENATVSLYDINGRCLHTEKANPSALTINAPAKGIYIIEIAGREEKIKLKIGV